MLLKQAALFYKAQGISAIAIGENKRSIYNWKEYQSRIPTDKEIDYQFKSTSVKGIATICGQVSGNLEVIDVDLKYDTTGTLWQRLQDEIGQELLSKLYCVQTKSGGYHLYYRCEIIEGNLKLANRPANSAELADNPHIKQVVLIETRGEGGYVVAPPTDGYTRKNDFIINVITSDEREQLFTACRSFDDITEIVKTEAKIDIPNYSLSPWEDYNNRADAIKLLEDSGWTVVRKSGDRTILKRPGQTDSKSSGDFHHGLNLFKVFTTSSEFEPGKGYKPFAIYAKLHHNNDFSAAARQLKNDGYGKQSIRIDIKTKDHISKSLSENKSFNDIVDDVIAKDQCSRKEAEKKVNDVKLLHGDNISMFWDVVQGKVKINRRKLVDFLYENGYRLFFYNDNKTNYKIIHHQNGFINDATTQMMKTTVLEYINKLPDNFDGINVNSKDKDNAKNKVKEALMNGSDSYFGNNIMEFMKNDPDDKIVFLKDEIDCAYFPFMDGIVKVTKDGWEMIKYGGIDKCVWESQVIKKKITIDNNFDITECEFAQFCYCVCNLDDNKMKYMASIIGYLLHRYKDQAKPFAVVLAEENENEKDGGGTGKGILVKALSEMFNVERVDGKNFKLTKSFAFQRVGLDTNVIAIEDVRKNVDFEGFYSIITEGVTVEKKNKDEFFIPYKDSPKILFTTNYTISQNGNHAKRRQKVFEFSNYFNSRHTPYDQFEHKLLDDNDWTLDEWNNFYNFMFLCVRDYLREGIQYNENGEKLNRKHIRLNYSEEFLEWWDTTTETIKPKFTPFKELYNDFLLLNDLDKKDFSQKRFKKAIEECCERFGYQLTCKRNGQSRILEYMIYKNAETIKEKHNYEDEFDGF